MKQIVLGRKGVFLEDVPCPTTSSGKVIVKTIYSAISTGTEIKSSGSKGKLFTKLKPDMAINYVKKTFSDGAYSTFLKFKNKLIQMSPLGYSLAGIVVDKSSDVKNINVGDKVVCGGFNHASHAEFVSVPSNLVAKIPNGVDIKDAAFTTIGSIALHSVRRADLKIGETCAVIGLGLIGQITVQILKSSGVTVFGADIVDKKIKLANEHGAIAFKASEDYVGKILSFTEERGVDAVIICASTNSSDAINTACKIVRDRGKIVVVGDTKLDAPRNLFLRKEIEIISSRSMGPGRFDKNYEEQNKDYPYAYVRWTENRNMQQFLDLLKTKKVQLSKMIDGIYELKHAESAFEKLSKDKNTLGIILKYDDFKYPDALSKKIFLTEKIDKHKINVGFAGLGNFAQSVHLPNIYCSGKYALRAVCSSDGLRSKHIAKLFNSDYCTTEFNELLRDKDIDIIFIASKNGRHADMAISAADAKKAIFLEKPMCMSYAECQKLTNSIIKNKVKFTLGLNRRFSPFAEIIKKLLSERNGPIMINYRMNEGKNLERAEEDFTEGGKILQVGCHMIDFCAYLIGFEPLSIFTENIFSDRTDIALDDNVAMITKFSDGSLANMFYSVIGDTISEKERIEIYADKLTIILKDFQELEVHDRGKTKKIILKRPDKGHFAQIIEFYKYLRGENAKIITLNDSIRSVIFSLKAIDSLKTKKIVDMELSKYFV